MVVIFAEKHEEHEMGQGRQEVETLIVDG